MNGQYNSSMMSSSHFQAGQATKSHPSSPAKTGARVYTSVAEMKRKGKVRFELMCALQLYYL